MGSLAHLLRLLRLLRLLLVTTAAATAGDISRGLGCPDYRGFTCFKGTREACLLTSLRTSTKSFCFSFSSSRVLLQKA